MSAPSHRTTGKLISHHFFTLGTTTLALVALIGGRVALAGDNPNATAQLSWSATGDVTDLTTPGVQNELFIRLNDLASFKGAEFDMHWDPAGDPDVGCIAHVST